MDITFCVTPGNETSCYPISSRILTENLLRDKRFNVNFSDNIIYARYHGSKKFYEHIEANSDEIFRRFSYFNVIWILWLKAYFTTLGCKDDFLNKIKGDYLFYSGVIIEFDLFMVKYALEKGVKVVFGGAIIFQYSFEELRKMMREIGATDEQLKNLIFVKGYVDLTTDLYKIVKDWKDTLITENDFSTFWDCERDFLQDHVSTLRRFETLLNSPEIKTTANILFDSRCWWGKCKYCAYRRTPYIKPIDWASPNKIIDNILNTVDRYKTKDIFITDNFFRFTDRNKIILEELVKRDMKIVIYAGIQSILNKEYIENLNKYISIIKFGLESTNDFALKYISKGFGRSEIIKAFDNLAKYSKKDLEIYSILIFDLPYLTKEDAIENFDFLVSQQEKMFSKGLEKWYYNFNILSVMKPLESQMTSKFLKTTTMDDEYLVGRSTIWKYIERLGFDSKFSTTNNIPLRRMDKDGKPIPSDVQLISHDTAQILIQKRDDWKLKKEVSIKK